MGQHEHSWDQFGAKRCGMYFTVGGIAIDSDQSCKAMNVSSTTSYSCLMSNVPRRSVSSVLMPRTVPDVCICISMAWTEEELSHRKDGHKPEDI